MQVKVYENLNDADEAGIEVKTWPGNRVNNLVRAQGLASASAAQHGGRVTLFFVGDPTKTNAIRVSESADVPGFPNAHYRIFR